MRLTGPLNLTLDGPPELGFYASRAHGGFSGLLMFRDRGRREKPPRGGDAVHPPGA